MASFSLTASELVDAIRKHQETLTDDDRLDLWARIQEGYCPHCGDHLPCHCPEMAGGLSESFGMEPDQKKQAAQRFAKEYAEFAASNQPPQPTAYCRICEQHKHGTLEGWDFIRLGVWKCEECLKADVQKQVKGLNVSRVWLLDGKEI